MRYSAYPAQFPSGHPKPVPKDMAQDFLDVYVKGQLKWATQITYKSTVETHLLPEFKGMKLEEIEVLAMGNELTVYLNPQDYDRIKKHSAPLMSVLQTTQTLQIKASENVKPSGCIIESELGTIDAQLDYQLEAIKKALEIET